MLNGILWCCARAPAGANAPTEYGPWQTLSTRFYRWVKAGIWDRILAELQRQGDAQGEVDWDLHHVDGSVIRAHQHAAGAQKRGSARPSA